MFVCQGLIYTTTAHQQVPKPPLKPTPTPSSQSFPFHVTPPPRGRCPFHGPVISSGRGASDRVLLRSERCGYTLAIAGRPSGNHSNLFIAVALTVTPAQTLLEGPALPTARHALERHQSGNPGRLHRRGDRHLQRRSPQRDGVRQRHRAHPDPGSALSLLTRPR